MMEEKKTKLPLIWKQEKKVLTLEGEPVLTYYLDRPELQGKGWGRAWINRYYRHQAMCWRKRWETEVYWKACLDLAACRAASRPFQSWSGKLEGEVTAWENGVLSIRLAGEECRGNGLVNRVCWGDVWKVKEGSPCSAAELLGGKRGWKKRAVQEIVKQGKEKVERGDCVLDPKWERKIRPLVPNAGFYIVGDGVEVVFPQGVIAPHAEGTPTFFLMPHKTQGKPAAEG